MAMKRGNQFYSLEVEKGKIQVYNQLPWCRNNLWDEFLVAYWS